MKKKVLAVLMVSVVSCITANYAFAFAESSMDRLEDIEYCLGVESEDGITVMERLERVEDELGITNHGGTMPERLDRIEEEVGVIDANTDKTSEDENEKEHIEFDVIEEKISEDDIDFSLYRTVNEAGRELGYVTQMANPEVSFDESKQNLEYARFYVSYFGTCTKEEAQETVESYTDELMYVVQNTYPNISMESLTFFWNIPDINKDSLYAATFFSEEGEDGALVRKEGFGEIYE